MTDRSYSEEKKSAQLCFDHFLQVTADNNHLIDLPGCSADQNAPFDHGEHQRGEFLIVPICFKNALPNPLCNDIDDQLLASIHRSGYLFPEYFVLIINFHPEIQ